MISLVPSRTAHAQEPVCVPFLRGSVSFEGLEPEIWTKDVLVKGLLGALPQPSMGIGALSRWPPTLTIPSVRTGRKGRSGLLLDSAQLA